MQSLFRQMTLQRQPKLRQQQHLYQLKLHHCFSSSASSSIPTDTSVTSGKMKNHTLPPSSLKGFPKSSSTEDRGVAPSSINWPVVSARYSAFAIGPKSRFIKIKVGTATRLKIA